MIRKNDLFILAVSVFCSASSAFGMISKFGYSNSGMENTPINLVKAIANSSVYVEKEQNKINEGRGLKANIGYIISRTTENLGILIMSREIANNDGQEWTLNSDQLQQYRRALMMAKDYEKVRYSALTAMSKENSSDVTAKDKDIEEYKALFPSEYEYVSTISKEEVNTYIPGCQKTLELYEEELKKVEEKIGKK